MLDAPDRLDELAFLAGQSEMAERIRAYSWRETPLGPPERWPESLKTAVRIMLTSRQPIWIGWGEDLTYLYNDAYKSIIGGKHPQMLGQPVALVWSELWDVIGPMLSSAMQGDEGTYVESQLLIMERNGYPEETYYTFSYSPIPGADGMPGGVICANTDDTQRVLGERQLALLHELARVTADARSAGEACERSAQGLASNVLDLPFSLIYLEGSDGRMELAALSGLKLETGQARDLTRPSNWPLSEVLASKAIATVGDLDLRFGEAVPTGAWGQPPVTAAVVPVPGMGDESKGGVLVVGLNPFRLFDDGYRNFLALAAGQIAAGLAGAQAYEAERARAESLAELDRAKTTFFSNISHEFRTPLTLMIGPVEDLLDGDISPAVDSQLKMVHRNSLRLLRLVNTMLSFSRIEAGRTTAEYEPVDLSSYTADLASVFRAAIENAGLELVVRCDPLPQPVYVDRDMWEKIVLNLLSNAFKYTLSGRIEVTVSAQPESARLTVRDTGVGIASEELPRIFDRFHRVEGVKGRTHEGSGIGLALVQELIKLHHGTIEVSSRPDEGTEFRIDLPWGVAHLDPERVHSSGTSASASAEAVAFVEEALRWLPGNADHGNLTWHGTDGRRDLTGPVVATVHAEDRPRILWVDDNRDMRDYVSRLLGDRFEVSAVGDGLAALDAARAQKPDLVLSDVMMPHTDGLDFLRTLRADSKLRDVPVILLSARAGEDARIEGLEAGADDYLVKPFSARELIARIDSHLRLSQARQEAAAAVRDSEERYRRLAALLPVAVYTCRAPTGVITFYNNQAAELWGRAPAIGDTDERFCGSFRLWTPEGDPLPHDQTPMAVALRDGTSFRNREVVIERPDGTRITVRVNIDAIRNADGRIVAAVNAFHDVTVLKHAEDALVQSEDQFRRAIECAPIPVIMHTEDGEILQLSRAWTDFTGYSVEDLEAMTGWLTSAYGPDRAGLMTVLEVSDENDLPIHSVELEVATRSGEVRTWSYSASSPGRLRDGRRFIVGMAEDITERRRAEEAIRFQANLIDNVEQAVIATDLTGRIIFWNRFAEQLYGWTEEEAVGQNVSTFITAPQGEEHSRSLMDALAAGEAWRGEFEVQRKDGSTFMAYVADTPLYEDGKQVGVVGISMDISDRKRSEDAMRESEERFRQMADSAPVLIWLEDPDKQCLFVNKPWLDFTGRTMEQELGRGWSENVHPDDIEPTLTVCSKAFETRAPFEVEYRLRRRDGNYRWMLNRGRPLYGPSGIFTGYIGSCLDITPRRRAEDTLRFMAETSAQLAESLDVTETLDKIAHISLDYFADWCTIHIVHEGGRIERATVAHKDPAKKDFALRLMKEGVSNEPVKRILEVGKPVLIPDITALPLDLTDEQRQLLAELGVRSFIGVPLSANGRSVGTISFVRSDVKNAYDKSDVEVASEFGRRAGMAIENARLVDELQRAIKVKDEFLGLVSHELRTPLTPILGMSKILLGGLKDEESVLEAASVIAESAEGLQILIENMLILARLDRGELHDSLEPAHLVNIARKVVIQHQQLYPQRELNFEQSANVPLVEGQAGWIEQVLQNFLSNAEKYAGDGIPVTVSIETVDDEVVVRVIDRGQGIGAQQAELIFDPFYRDPSTANKANGAGLGLAVSKRLVDLQRGRIWAKSVPSGGAEFGFALPALHLDEDLDAEE